MLCKFAQHLIRARDFSSSTTIRCCRNLDNSPSNRPAREMLRYSRLKALSAAKELLNYEIFAETGILRENLGYRYPLTTSSRAGYKETANSPASLRNEISAIYTFTDELQKNSKKYYSIS